MAWYGKCPLLCFALLCSALFCSVLLAVDTQARVAKSLNQACECEEEFGKDNLGKGLVERQGLGGSLESNFTNFRIDPLVGCECDCDCDCDCDCGGQAGYLFSCPLIVDRYPQYGTRVVSSLGMNLMGLLVKALVVCERASSTWLSRSSREAHGPRGVQSPPIRGYWIRSRFYLELLACGVRVTNGVQTKLAECGLAASKYRSLFQEGHFPLPLARRAALRWRVESGVPIWRDWTAMSIETKRLPSQLHALRWSAQGSQQRQDPASDGACLH
ncbi:hypothetical protein B0T13DRAFT_444278 [Neurospora crassa]|nr:hypothetical protein B0T13DRAFT_444278 [Neurospora crassa]